jgi:uncharacterized protein YecT (DUF1311 family)
MMMASALRSFPLVAGAFCAIAGGASGAEAADTERPADRAAVEACLAQVKKNAPGRVPEGPSGTVDTNPAARLRAAQEEAVRDPLSCAGIVANACLAAPGNESTAAMVECHSREYAVWDARLNAAYQKALAAAKAGNDREAEEGFRKVQRAWIAYRDASCEVPHLVFKGTMAQPVRAACMLDMTARQSIWLENWAENAGEN